MATLAKLLVALGLDAKEYDKGLDDAEEKAHGFGTKIGGFLGGAMKAGLAATAGGVIGAIGAIVTGVASNAEFERYETQFGVLLGSTEAAQQRLEELAAFGATTPFELPEVVRADKILQSFGLHSLEAAERFGTSGEAIRKIVGDTAAGTGAGFEEIALYMGKLSTGNIGEVLERFSELGITSRSELAKMGIEFSKSGELVSPLEDAFAAITTVMQDKFGGMMDAQSKTFEGMMSNLSDWISGTLRALSAPIFEVVRDKLSVLLGFLNAPETQAALQSFATNLANGVGVAMDFISGTVIPAFQTAWTNLFPTFMAVVGFVQNVISTISNIAGALSDAGGSSIEFRDVLISVFGGNLGAAIADFVSWLQVRIPQAITVVNNFVNSVLIPAFSAAWDFILANIIPLLADVATWLLRNIPIAIDTIVAFINDPLIPAFALVAGFITGNVVPIFQAVFDWLSVNIPTAVETTSDFWHNTLMPALTTVRTFIANYLIPIFAFVANVAIVALNGAIQVLAGFWNTILLPAIKGVWNFISEYVVPLFTVLVAVHIATLGAALRTLAAIWTNTVKPALDTVWQFIRDFLIPILFDLYDRIIEKGLKQALEKVAFFILGNVMPMFQNLVGVIRAQFVPTAEAAESVLGKVRDAFGWIDDAISNTIGWIQDVAAALSSISIPDWLQGHSPPPLAHWFDYIGEAARFANREFDVLNRQLWDSGAIMPQVPTNITGSALAGVTQNFDITAVYRQYEGEQSLRDMIRMESLLNAPTIG